MTATARSAERGAPLLRDAVVAASEATADRLGVEFPVRSTPAAVSASAATPPAELVV